MVDCVAYMLRKTKGVGAGRWHNWGGLTEWIADNPCGGTIWHEKNRLEEFVSQMYPDGDVEIVAIRLRQVVSEPVHSTRFELCIGVNAGYFHENDRGTSRFTKVWNEHAEEVCRQTGVYASGVVCEGKAVYRQEWGCPEGGEVVVKISGIRNAEFLKDDKVWREAVRETAKRVGKAFGQSKVYLEFMPAEFEYIDPSQ